MFNGLRGRSLFSIAISGALLLAFMFCGSTSPVCAGTIVVSQQPVDHAFARISDWSQNYQKSECFVLTGADLTIGKIHWWGAYGADPDPTTDEYFFKFFIEDPNTPGNPSNLGYTDSTRTPLSYTSADFQRTATNMVAEPAGEHDGGAVYEYWTILDRPITFTADVPYWVAITNRTPTWAWPSVPNSRWGWMEGSTGEHWYRNGHCKNCAMTWNLRIDKSLAYEMEAVSQASTIAQVRAMQPGEVFMLAAKPITCVAGSQVYIEEPNRSCGMKLNYTGTAPDLSKTCIVAGVYRGLVDNEPTADALTLDPGPDGKVKPVATSNKSIGWSGCGIPAYAGTDTRCLLITTCGKVTFAGADYFLVDDGSQVADNEAATGKKGLKVTLPADASMPSVGSFVVVTGISRTDCCPCRWIMPRSADDIR